MKSRITISHLTRNKLRCESREAQMKVAFRPILESNKVWIESYHEIAVLAERFSNKIELSTGDRDSVLRVFARVGLQLVRTLFTEQQWSIMHAFLNPFVDVEVELRNPDYQWIPWEILYFKKNTQTPAYQDFCGYRRTIYRIELPNGETMLADDPRLGFLRFGGLSKGSIASLALDMEEELIFRSQGKRPTWDRLDLLDVERRRHEERARLHEYLKKKDIIHFSAIIVPVLEKTFLLLDKNFWISPDDFTTGLPDKSLRFNRSPLVVLNGRDNYARNPFHVLEYIKTFRQLNAAGIITSEFPMPHRLAAEFSKEFYSRLFSSNRTIGKVLAETKLYFLDHLNNPFALFYVPYMPLMLQLGPKPPQDGSTEPSDPPPSNGGSELKDLFSPEEQRPDFIQPPDQSLSMTRTDLSANDLRQLARELDVFASWYDGGSQGKKAILAAAGIPLKYIDGLPWTNISAVDTDIVIRNLQRIGHMQERPTHRMLGALVEYLLRETPHIEGKLFLAYLIEFYQLITAPSYIASLRHSYPLIETPISDAPFNLGWTHAAPEFRWHGPANTPELEKVWNEHASFLDAVFLEQGTRAAQAVCRIERAAGEPLGTGFLIGPNLVLTNHHVIPGDDQIAEIRVRFGFRVDDTRQIQPGHVYRVIQAPRRSPADILDYVVLEIEGLSGADPAIRPLRYTNYGLQVNYPAFIIQHPRGDPQKVVLQDNWITYVDPNQRRVQYLTNTKRGSSGSPVFNEHWEVIALHHSDRPFPALPGASIAHGNEGIPMAAILPEIQDLLQ